MVSRVEGIISGIRSGWRCHTTAGIGLISLWIMADGDSRHQATDVGKRMSGAAEVHRTSVLQDLERGRPMEIEALLGVIVEVAEFTGCRRRPAGWCWRWSPRGRGRRGYRLFASQNSSASAQSATAATAARSACQASRARSTVAIRLRFTSALSHSRGMPVPRSMA